MPVDDGAGVDHPCCRATSSAAPGRGALIARSGAAAFGVARGSAHERGRRGGTENVAGIVGPGLASELAAAELAAQGAPAHGVARALRVRTARGDSRLRRQRRGAERPRTRATCRSRRARRPPAARVRRAWRDGVRRRACASGAVEPSPVPVAMACCANSRSRRCASLGARRPRPTRSTGRCRSSSRRSPRLAAQGPRVSGPIVKKGARRDERRRGFLAVARGAHGRAGSRGHGVTLRLACYGNSRTTRRVLATVEAMNDAKRNRDDDGLPAPHDRRRGRVQAPRAAAVRGRLRGRAHAVSVRALQPAPSSATSSRAWS